PNTFGEQKTDRWNRFSLLDLSPARYCSVQATAKPLVHGTLSRQSFSSHILGNARDVMIYQPRGAQPARWTLILFDGQVYQDEYHFANVLDG
ncbi:enterochelin esterase, partial [Klebsiella pneumoniae]|nr:enterochelin esterase [Klebsiella pneumoniae]